MQSRECGFIGCENVIVVPDFPWSMCDACYDEAD